MLLGLADRPKSLIDKKKLVDQDFSRILIYQLAPKCYEVLHQDYAYVMSELLHNNNVLLGYP